MKRTRRGSESAISLSWVITQIVVPEAFSSCSSAASTRRSRRLVGGLRTRLVFTFVVVALISAVTATALAYRDARAAVLQRTQNAAVNDLRERVAAVAADFDVPPDQESLSRFAAKVSDGIGARIVVARYQDLVAVSDSLAETEGRITTELRTAVRTGNGARLQRVMWRGEPYLAVGMPVTYADGDHRTSGLEVFAITDLRAERDDTAALLDSVRAGIVPVVLLAAVLALLAAGTVLRPVRKLGRATRELAAGDLGSRVAVTGHDELADLATTFNETADALQASDAELREQEAKARRFVADVSHELRTPLAAMTMVATVLEEDADQLPPDAARAARTVGAETARLSRLVEDLMEISRFDAKAVRLNAAETDLADAVRASLALRGWTDEVHTHLHEGVRAVVDRRRIDVIVANLVGNALRLTAGHRDPRDSPRWAPTGVRSSSTGEAGEWVRGGVPPRRPLGQRHAPQDRRRGALLTVLLRGAPCAVRFDAPTESPEQGACCRMRNPVPGALAR